MANLAISLNAATGIRFPAAMLAGYEGPLSICGWYKFNAQPGATFSSLQHVANFSSPFDNPYLQVYSGDSGPLLRQLGWDNGQTFKGTLIEPPINQWFYLTQIFRKLAPGDYWHRLWVDFAEESELANISIPLNAGITHLLTGDPTFGAPFNGSVAAVKIFGRLLNGAEQIAESAQRAPVLADDCLAAWGCRGAADLAQILGAGPASYFYQNPLSPVPAIDVAGPAALDGDEPSGDIDLADLPATIEVENLLDETLIVAFGLRFAGGETKTVQLAGLGPGAKSDLWEALRVAEANGHVAAGGMQTLADPRASGHSALGGHQLTGGQNAVGDTEPDVPPAPVTNGAVQVSLGGRLESPTPIADPHGDDWALCFWFRFDAEPVDVFSAAAELFKLGEADGSGYIRITCGDGGPDHKRLLTIYTGSGGKSFDIEPAVGTWVHLCVSWSPGANRLHTFTNGVYNGFAGIGAGLNPDCDTFCLGAPAGLEPVLASFRGIRWFNKALADNEEAIVAAEMASSVPVDVDIIVWNDLNGADDLTNKQPPLDADFDLVLAAGALETTAGPPAYD